MKKTPGRRLSFRFLVGFVLLAAAVSAASCIIGFVKYRSTIQRLYNENSYAIAGIALDKVDGDLLSGLLERDANGRLIRERRKEDGTWAVTDAPYEKGDRYRVASAGGEAYRRMAEELDLIRQSSNAQYILLYIPVRDEQTSHMVYFFDAQNDYFPQNQLGMTDPMNPKYFDEVRRIYDTGERSDSYFISHSAYGYTTSAMLPVRDGAGEVVAILDVYVPMLLIDKTLMEYVFSVILATVALVFLFVFLYLGYLRRKVLLPIQTITEHTERFVRDESGFSAEALDIHTGDEIELLARALGKMEIDLGTYIRELTAVTAEKERIGAELGVATHIQASMLPCIFPAFPERPEFDIYATMTPAKEVGGDFYDFFLVDDDHLAMVMADVSGKGVPAALFMVIAKTLIKNIAQTGLGPGAALEKANNQLCENNEAEMFVTAWLGVLELSTGRLVAANAGHEYPAVQKAGGDYALLRDKHGFVLAGMEGSRYQEYTLALHPGDRLYLYTDGVAEATDARSELYGTGRMLAALNRNKDASCETLLRRMQQDIDRFVGDAPQFDDITMLSLMLRGTEEQGK